ncbi:hypothetical protein AMTR_s00149p00098020 [Amborella trichopoda]|uniref:Thioesterase domain-containing protein n=1 Tax=Amborella trichopoda TaxID=13333 RepID=W1PH48_AMBTC|nr:hypothetical protein AMTR_s00149p00098020 [Amborella trichopoda]
MTNPALYSLGRLKFHWIDERSGVPCRISTHYGAPYWMHSGIVCIIDPAILSLDLAFRAGHSGIKLSGQTTSLTLHRIVPAKSSLESIALRHS